MDILKVLSRGTKRTGAAGRRTDAQPLPSAGTTVHPQLFDDEVRGLKRRKTGPDHEPDKADHEAAIDFFAPKVEAPKPSRATEPSPEPAPVELRSEDDCRRILRSHRIKVTLMTSCQTLPKTQSRSSGAEKMKTKTKSKSSSKSENKAKVLDAAAKSADWEQLFPQPLESFHELRTTYALSRRVCQNLAAQAFRIPTEVQLGSLPLLLRPEIALGGDNWADGIDFLAVAPTGSGKTIAFLLPLLNSIMRRRQQEGVRGRHQLEAVIVVPTRELAHQIVHQGRTLAQGTGVKIVGMSKGMVLDVQQQSAPSDAASSCGGKSLEEKGDAEKEEEAAEAEDENRENEKEACPSSDEANAPPAKSRVATKADILVTTPLLLLSFLQSAPSGSRRLLDSVRHLVLDEADVLLDPLFRDQTEGIWAACTNPQLRLSCWSATMGSSIESLVADKVASRVRALALTPKPLVRLVVGLKDTAVPNVSHRMIYTATEQGKLMALRQLLHPASGHDSGPPLRPPFLVFTQTIERAVALEEELKYDIPLEAGGSARIAALHSQLSDAARAAVMRRLRAGEVWVLITTDVLARGVDLAGVNGVVNYDVPGSSAAYVHRAGRTGRAGRQGGVAVTLYTKDDIPVVKTVANVIAASDRQAGKTGAAAAVQDWLLAALPDVAKADRKRLKQRGVESRRSGRRANITTQSGYDRRRDDNRRGAALGTIMRRAAQEESSRREGADTEEGGDWGGFSD